MKKNITLALETGIYGGSICLFKNGQEITGWISESEQTKSDEFLESIKKLLYDTQVNISEVNKIVISEGPGSYTGLRIGFSIAKGLKMALGIEIQGVSLLDEIAKGMRPITTAALPFGKSEICWKKVENKIDSNSKPQNPINFSHQKDFVNNINLSGLNNLILPRKLYNELLKYADLHNDKLNIFYCDQNFARIIGMTNQNFIYDKRVKIIYPKNF